MMIANFLPAVIRSDLIENEREFLYSGNDYLLSAFNELPEVAGVFGMPYCRAHLSKLLNCVTDLLVENTSVGDYDNGVKDLFVVFLEADKLVCKPGNGVTLATASRVLDKITVAYTVLSGMSEKLSNYV